MPQHPFSVILLYLLFFPSFSLWGQVEVQNTIAVSQDDEWAFVEPSLVVGPAPNGHMVVASMAFQKGIDGSVIKVFHSQDMGQKWIGSSFNSYNIPGNDPWLAVDDQGIFYLSFLPRQLYRSEDGGQHWEKLADWPDGHHDYPKMAIDRTDSEYNGRLYLWASHSEKFDSGKPKGPLYLMSKSNKSDSLNKSDIVLPNNFFNQVGDLVILPNGKVVVSFHEIDHYGNYVRYPRLWVMRSEDGGQTFSNPFLVHDYFQADSPDMAVDRTGGAFARRLYLTYMGVENLKERTFNQYLTFSDDEGESWSDPVIINEVLMDVDYPPHHARVAVNQSGYVGTSWRDPRGQENGNHCTGLYFSYSKDGGQTFSRDSLISDKAYCSDQPGNHIPVSEGGVPVSKRFKSGGDYHGMAALEDGAFGVVWSDSRTGRYQLYFTMVTIK